MGVRPDEMIDYMNEDIRDLKHEVARLQGQFSAAYLLLIADRMVELRDLLDDEASGIPYTPKSL